MMRSPRRYLAPAALVTLALAVALEVRSGVGGGSTTSHSATTASTARHRPVHRYAHVRPGDSLSAISLRTHVSLVTLEQLNPNVDPNALHAGERIRLR